MSDFMTVVCEIFDASDPYTKYFFEIYGLLAFFSCQECNGH